MDRLTKRMRKKMQIFKRASQLSTRKCEEKSVKPPFHNNPLLCQVPTNSYFTPGSESAILLTHFLGEEGGHFDALERVVPKSMILVSVHFET